MRGAGEAGRRARLPGLLAAIHGFELILRELSGMDAFVFQAGGGADAVYTLIVMTRAYFAARGELEPCDEIVTTIQGHPCNPATAATAGFKVVTLPQRRTSVSVCTRPAGNPGRIPWLRDALIKPWDHDKGAVRDLQVSAAHSHDTWQDRHLQQCRSNL